MYTEEVFDTAKERNERWYELRRTHTGVIRYSEPRDTEKGWKDKFIVAYPMQLIVGQPRLL